MKEQIKQTKNQYKEGKNCVRKFAFATRVGFHPHNPGKVNQDQYILTPNVQGLPALHIFGVCDGHGQYGKEVSSFVKAVLPVLIEQKYQRKVTDLSIEADGFKSTDKLALMDPYYVFKQQIRHAFLQMNSEIEANVPNC